jgi:glycosyltransferase involved in cell wall biosynthesis
LGVEESIGRGTRTSSPTYVDGVHAHAPSLFLLKNPPFGPVRPDGVRDPLPYRADLLTDVGVDLQWSDRHLTARASERRFAVTLDRLQRLGAPPMLQTAMAWRQLKDAAAVVAMFESEGNAYALSRALHVPGARRPRFAVLSCWLAESLPRLPAHRRAMYRLAYRSVDRLYYFSANQTATYQRYLDIPDDRLRPIRFGVDVDDFAPRDRLTDEFVLVAGRDRGRDWPTTFAALAATRLPAKVLCRLSDLRGAVVPDNVEIVGYVERDVYRDYLARARVVVVATRPMAYPSGQTVALEAMAMGKYCVVTETPAFSDYVVPGAVAPVPPGDAASLAEAIERGYYDVELREDIGAAATAAVRSDYSAGAMWSTIATDLLADSLKS